MKSRRSFLAAISTLILASAVLPQQATPPAAENSLPTIKKEAGLVVVDAVVTDKKGNYIRDLTAKDFRVFEDNKEQTIKSFSSESNAAAPTVDQHRYLVLFFDNSTMSLADQGFARQSALKFLDTNAGANRYIAVVDFGGALRIAQNFTTDVARLKQAAGDPKFSGVSPNSANAGIAQLGNVSANFGARTFLLALRDLATGLAAVPGRKTLVLLSEGFPLRTADWEIQAELVAAINACNKANVAVYPIDVRGVGAVSTAPPLPIAPASESARLMGATLRLNADGDEPAIALDGGQNATSQAADSQQAAHLIYVQKGGGGGGGGRTGGGGVSSGAGRTTGATGSGGATTTIVGASTPYTNGQGIIPTIGNGAHNQDVLYELAQGTGGFVIGNTNDLLGGLQKIAQEQDQYYLLSYTPPASEEGNCHTLKVKVDRSDTIVRSRSGYCNVRSTNMLAGKPIENQLEAQAKGSQAGNVPAAMQAPYFYTAANVARVNVAVDIPGSAIKFEKKNGKQHATVNVLGLAYTPDGTLSARFSDTVEFDLESKDQVEQFAKFPYRYENQFEIASGHYNLKVVFNSGGNNFGKLEMPLVVDSYDAKELSISTVAISKDVHPLNQAAANLNAELLEGRRPLVAQGMEIIPAGTDHFKKSEPTVLYLEIYDPHLTDANPPKVGIQVLVLDRKTGEKKVDMGGLIPNVPAGNPVVPFGMQLPLDKLTPGSYQLDIKAIDTAGNTTTVRKTDFEVE
jgi:VWFA-related protein